MTLSIREYERPFAMNHYQGNLDAEGYFDILHGQIPVLVSAPHSVNQIRDNEVKKADIYTGAIAAALHDLTSCYGIFSTKISEEDPNYVMGGSYKEAIAGLVRSHGIRFVIDLHGAAESRDFDIDLGTIHGESMNQAHVTAIEEIFKSNHIMNVKQNDSFPAEHPGTITNYVSQCLSVPSIQMEINRSYRDPDDEVGLQRILDSLQQIIMYLAGASHVE